MFASQLSFCQLVRNVSKCCESSLSGLESSGHKQGQHLDHATRVLGHQATCVCYVGWVCDLAPAEDASNVRDLLLLMRWHAHGRVLPHVDEGVRDAFDPPPEEEVGLGSPVDENHPTYVYPPVEEGMRNLFAPQGVHECAGRPPVEEGMCAGMGIRIVLSCLRL